MNRCDGIFAELRDRHYTKFEHHSVKATAEDSKWGSNVWQHTMNCVEKTWPRQIRIKYVTSSVIRRWEYFNANECVSKSFRTESITKCRLNFGITRWGATQRVMAAKLTRLTHKIAIQLLFKIIHLDFNATVSEFLKFFNSVRKMSLVASLTNSAPRQWILHRIKIFFLLELLSLGQTYGNNWGKDLNCMAGAPSIHITTHLLFRPSDWPYEDGRFHATRWRPFEVFHGVWIWWQFQLRS
jgi:hypothetical protein